MKDQAARKRIVLEQLLELKQAVDNGRTDRSALCSEVTYPLELHPYFHSWEYFSDNMCYPIPGGCKQPPSKAYKEACIHGSFWEGQYGRLRYSLLEHIIQCLEEELCQNSNQGTSS